MADRIRRRRQHHRKLAKKRRKRAQFLFGLVLACAALIFGVTYFVLHNYVSKYPAEIICDHIYIGGMDVSGMTKEEALQALEEHLAEDRSKTVTLQVGKKNAQATLEELGYGYSYEVLNAKYFGVPQNRERLFIIAWYKELIDVENFRFPYGISPDGSTIYEKEKLKEGTLPTKVSDVFEPLDKIDAQYTISDKMWEGHQKRKERNKQNGKGFGYSLFNANSIYTSTISARYWKDGSEILIDQSEKGLNPRILTPVEAGRLQGYRIIGNGWEHEECANNDNNNSSNVEFKIVVSNKEAYRQFGNSVAVPVIKRIAQEIVKQLMK